MLGGVDGMDSLTISAAILMRWRRTLQAPAEGVSPQPDVTCEHGTAMDVHCCHCHSGFIFDQQHECPPLPDTADTWRESIEGALGVESDPENHTATWARELVLVIREHGNATPVSPAEPTPEPPNREYDRMLAWRDLDREVDDICFECGGSGALVYGNTSTWRGGVGGNAMTRGVCNKCWGSGDTSKPWTNLRSLPTAPTVEPAPCVWRDIATAPKDGTWFLAWDEDCGYYTYRDGPGFIPSEEPAPTHWMPLPAPPLKINGRTP